MLEEFANLPGHALANTIDAGAALIQPDQLVKAAQQVYRDPQPAIQGLKDFGAEVAERPVALMEQLDLTDLIPGLAALPPGSNKFLKTLGKADAPAKMNGRVINKHIDDVQVSLGEKEQLARESVRDARLQGIPISDPFTYPAKDLPEAAEARRAAWPQGSGANGEMRTLSLFDGLGGTRVALKNLDAPVEYMASEIDPHAIKVHQKNFPDTKQLGNVTDINSQDLGPVDLLVGGSPCQDLSCAKKGGLGLEGPSSGLFFEYVNTLQSTKPKYFVFENVASMKSGVKERISEILGVEPIMIDAKNVSAQGRKRLFWTNIPTDLPKNRDIKLQDILEKEVDPSFTHTEKGVAYMNRRVKDGRTHLDFGHHTDARSQDKSRTLVANLSKGVPYNVLIDETGTMRKFTPREVERLAGVPDDFTEGVSNTQRYKMLGNGFQIQVMEHILSGIPRSTQ